MYQTDSRDSLVELSDVPPCEPGAPQPIVFADDDTLTLGYITATPAVDDPVESEGELFAIVRFRSPVAHLFGPPNDETSAGHPLYSRGFQPYSSFEVLSSSWIRQLAQMNSVHPRHDPTRFAAYRHFIFSFHDSTFECVAAAFSVTTVRGPVSTIVAHMAVR